MASVSRAFDGRAAIAAAFVAASLCGLGQSALASPEWLRKAWGAAHGEDGRQRLAPPVAKYEIDEGGAFILDRSGRRPLLKFEESPEVWVLAVSRGPRGDTIYRDDTGDMMLRATELGGMTVFTPRRPEGSAAAMAGASLPLRLASVGPLALYQRILQASVRSSRAAQHLVGFDAPEADAGSDGLIADAAAVAAEALVSLATRQGGKAALARVQKVDLVKGGRPQVMSRGGMIIITIVPALGVAGRPSSERILRAVGAR
ncbi:MAG TPA: DUF4908 domain-containing protein [Caulobacteraceae bacterium]